MHVDNRGRPYFDNAGRKVLATASFIGVEPSFIEQNVHAPMYFFFFLFPLIF